MRQGPGIYAIRHQTSGRMYIGGSQNVSQRCRSHRWHLRNGQHKNHQLQAAWDFDGEAEFEFLLLETLDTIDAPTIQAAEDRWIRTSLEMDPQHLFNLQIGAGTGFTISSQTRFRMAQSQAAAQRPEGIGQKISAAKKGKRFSDAHRAALSTASCMTADWLVTRPDGTQVAVRNLQAFCREHQLCDTVMRHTANGKVKSHRGGWRCQRLTPHGGQSQ